VFKELSLVGHVPVKKLTKEQEGTVKTAAKFTECRQTRRIPNQRRDTEEGAKSHT
jgi:hypothetical protein